MIKAKLFDYNESKIYYQTYGISPDLHFDLLCEKWGREVAIEIVDRNMQKSYEEKWKEEQRKRELEQKLLEAECPF